MTEIKNLAYFLNSMKETLVFDNEKDFNEKIKKNRKFRIKVQKLVYLSKFFGWKNEYHFNFHQRCPYSVELTQDYNKLNYTLISSSKNTNLTTKSFKEFIKNQDLEFFEATSTILYYIGKLNIQTINKHTIVNIMKYIKPHLSKNTIENSYEKIMEFKLFNQILKNENYSLSKEVVMDKLNGLINIFKSFDEGSNQTLILGSLDYLRITLKRENLEKNKKKN